MDGRDGRRPDILSLPVGIAAVTAALALFGWVGLRAGGERDLEQYVVARETQSGGAIGLSFLASGVGAWMLFAPPEVGARVGLLGVLGYAAAVVAPLLALGYAGRRVRGVMPAGRGLTDFVRVRFGRPVHLAVIGITLGYMLVATTAELTAAGAVLSRLTGLDPRVGILALVGVTLVYTAYGGLRASLRTDGWQSWMLLGLLGLAGVALVVRFPDPVGSIRGSGLLALDASGAEAAVTLIVAVVVTTLFNNGYWQRVWAARDDAALRRGVWIGSALRVLPIMAVGFAGILAAGAALDLGDPPVPFFALLAGLPSPILVLVLVLAVALVASSVDTLENGMGSLIAIEGRGKSLRGARAATVLLMVPATAAAFQGYSVLRILLVADLLCAAAVVPVLLGLWRRATSSSAMSGILAGLGGAVVPGWLASGSLVEGLRSVTFPDAAIDLPPFAAALIASTIVSVGVGLVAGRSVDVRALGDRVEPVSSGRVPEEVGR